MKNLTYILLFLFTTMSLSEATPKRVLIGSIIKQKPAILEEFLASLDRLEQNTCTHDYCFIDDNIDDASINMLATFSKKYQNRCRILKFNPYSNNDPQQTVKFNKIIDVAQQENFDYLLVLNSNLVLHPYTIEQLILAGKEVVSNAIWNKATNPNRDSKQHLENCILIKQSTLEKNLSIEKINPLEFHIDSHLPAYQIYNESFLDDVATYKKRCGTKITLSMIVKNEADRYLREVLEATKPYITNAVIIDDASTDNTVDLCRKVLRGIPLKIVQNETSKFSQEYHLRMQQWEETISTNPDWIFILDADEVPEKRFESKIKDLVRNLVVDCYGFRLFDFWDKEHYREDRYWNAHFRYWGFLIRYNPEVEYTWNLTNQHCGRAPKNAINCPNSMTSDLRIKHFGWANEKDRLIKYNRYLELDPDCKYGWKEQYESILDPDPHLIAWKD